MATTKPQQKKGSGKPSFQQKHLEPGSPPTALQRSKSRPKARRFTDVRGLPCIGRMVSSVEETPEPICTDIVGQIPEWLDGNFLRNGPGKFEIGNQKWVKPRRTSAGARGRSSTCACPFFTRFNHWFDGMALLHQFKIARGQVTYKSRFLSSDSYQANRENNRITVSEFGTITLPDPCKNFFQRFLSRFELPSRCLVEKVTLIPASASPSLMFSRAHRQRQRQLRDLQRRLLRKHRNHNNSQA